MKKVLSIALLSIGVLAMADVLSLNKGWNLLGSSKGIDLEKVFNKQEVKTIWRWVNGKWEIYSKCL